jgi:hypothetical protein
MAAKAISRKTIFILTIIVGVVFISYKMPKNALINYHKEVIKVDTVSLPSRKVFLVDIRRGFSYVVKKITLSKDLLSAEIDEEKEFVFRTDLDIFYEIKSDTLVIYTRKISAVPINFPKDVIIKQVELDNANYMNLYDEYDIKGIKYF